jgi:hypothetical protein
MSFTGEEGMRGLIHDVDLLPLIRPQLGVAEDGALCR